MLFYSSNDLYLCPSISVLAFAQFWHTTQPCLTGQEAWFSLLQWRNTYRYCTSSPGNWTINGEAADLWDHLCHYFLIWSATQLICLFVLLLLLPLWALLDRNCKRVHEHHNLPSFNHRSPCIHWKVCKAFSKWRIWSASDPLWSQYSKQGWVKVRVVYNSCHR